jgi:hypothetical protein
MHKYAVIGILIKLFLGSANYFTSKAMNSTCGEPLYTLADVDPECPPGESQFKKAFFVVFCNFFSLSLCLVIFALFRRKKLDPEPYRTKENYLRMLIPGSIEAVAFCLSTSAQILMSLSLAMIMKGAKVIFSAVFTTVYLKRKLPYYKWFSVGVCMFGLAIAGISECMKVAKSGKSPMLVLIALGMALLSECMFAFQVIFDERMMKQRKCDVTFVVGMEGVTGIVILIPVVLSAWLLIGGSQGDSYENLQDTFYRIGDSALLTGLLVFFICDIFIVAMADATITKYLSGVHSSLVSVGRTIVVWLLELTFAACLPEHLAKQYGQTWDTPWSYVKATGFIIVVVAIFMYDGTIKVPGFNYETTPGVELIEEKKIIIDASPTSTEEIRQ